MLLSSHSPRGIVAALLVVEIHIRKHRPRFWLEIPKPPKPLVRLWVHRAPRNEGVLVQNINGDKAFLFCVDDFLFSSDRLSVAENDIFLYFVKMTFLHFLKKATFSSFVTFDRVQLLISMVNSHKVWGSNSQLCVQQCGKLIASALLWLRCLKIRKSDIRWKNSRFLSIFEHLYFLMEERSQGMGHRISK